jgi:hypothetical protein
MLQRVGAGGLNSKVSTLVPLLLGIPLVCLTFLITIPLIMNEARLRPVIVPLVLPISPLIGLLFYVIVANQKDTRAKRDAVSSTGSVQVTFRELERDIEMV